jgi:hypothetical protein
MAKVKNEGRSLFGGTLPIPTVPKGETESAKITISNQGGKR